jgi:hypothetical protein
MTRPVIGWIVLGILFLTGSEGTVRADLIAEHQGATDPTTEGFSLWPFNGGISTSALSNDMGLPAWSITSTPPGSQQAAYNFPALSASALLSQGFTMSLEARAVSGAVYSTPTNQPIAAAIVGLATVRFDLELGLDANGNTIAILANTVGLNGDGSFNLPGASVTVPGNGYHLYQLAYNPASHTADLFIDGVDRIQGYQGHSEGNLFTGFYFGALDHGTANFNLARLETGIDVGAVPEPSTMTLGGVGALLWLGYAFRRRTARRRLARLLAPPSPTPALASGRAPTRLTP